ncbi:type II toxin-antitoxin system HicA family toxin [Parvularcula maris]|uniref:Type II toxin-antitoxin system HicA family toxin n=1 Tax=Parvularcula maris TaxID=2965077 RepID=A0A9X2L6K3_9PROT|nr:type II toxin-antitoxin system HicA family toxin [Parvularcula maris]MCQ8184013.1 type II toxin-antitoxin system HicA family toxin [Parvularcula maris]
MVEGFYKQMIAALRDEGFRYWKPGKGSHEKWIRDSDRKVVLVSRSKSRHTANETMKQAGIDKRF